MGNGFTPGFGVFPARLAGRQEILRRWRAAFDPGASAGDPARRTYLEGPRGVGKTTLLDALQDVAVERGWLVIEDNAVRDATPLSDKLTRRLTSYRDDPASTASGRIGLRLGPVSAERSWKPPKLDRRVEFRDAVTALFAERDGLAGLLVTLDEVHDCDHDEFKVLANQIQHLLRGGIPVAFAAAGLPATESGDSATANAIRTPTFLARSWMPAIGEIDDIAVLTSLEATAATTGHRFDPPALRRAVDASGGLPYAMQLVGWYSVDAANRDGRSQVALDDVAGALASVHHDLTRGLRLPVELSARRREYVDAMALDAGPSRTSDVAARLGRTLQQLSPHRAWLLEHGVIHAPEHGLVAFSHPGMRAWSRTHPSAPPMIR